MTATEVPTMGVHKPRIKRNPATRRIAAVIVMFSGGSPHSRKPARITSTDPITSQNGRQIVPHFYSKPIFRVSSV